MTSGQKYIADFFELLREFCSVVSRIALGDLGEIKSATQSNAKLYISSKLTAVDSDYIFFAQKYSISFEINGSNGNAGVGGVGEDG